MILTIFTMSTYSSYLQQINEINKNYPKDVNVRVINIDKDIQLRDQFNIKSIPTTIFATNWDKEIKRWVGTTDANTINEFIKEYEENNF